MTFDATDEAARQRALDSYHILDSLPENTYDDIARLASTLCGTPIALVSLIDRERQWSKAKIGVEADGVPRDIAFCNHALANPTEMLEVGDLSGDRRFAENPLVTGEFAARFYAGMPLVAPGGVAIGTVCVIDHQPRTLSEAQRKALESLARLTMHLMESRNRERVTERAALVESAVASAAVAPVAAAAPAPVAPALDRAGGYTVVILEMQDFAGVVKRLGERTVDRALQQLDDRLSQCLDGSQGDVVDRVTGSNEFIAVLQGTDTADTVQRLRDALPRDAGYRVLIGAAAASHAGEPTMHVYLRADEALSAAKDAQPMTAAA